MVGPECVQPVAQALADRILNHADDAFYLPIAPAIASRRLLVDGSEHFAQMRKAPLEFRPMVRSYIPRFPPSVHDVF